MALQVLMPKIGLTMTEGKILEWRKKEGERVEKGEILFVFETEKSTIEVEAPGSGILSKILVQPEETVPVGTVVGIISAVGEGVEIVPEKPPEAPLFRGVKPVELGKPPEKIRATPLARKMAREKGLDLRSVAGSGAAGRIRRTDIDRLISSQPPPPTASVPPGRPEKGKLVKFTGMRRIIAQKMLASKVETAQIYMTHTIDASRILEARERLLPVVEKKTGVRLTLTDILVKITAAAITLHPVMNTRWTPEGILWLEEIHMGVAMALPDGLMVPVIWNVDKKSLSEVAQARAELVEKGRKGKLIPDETKGSTFTLSSLGMYGIEEFCPIINQPESAILGVGAILEQPVAVNKQVVIRPMMKVTLSYDHRVIDGARAAEFMKTLKEVMEGPLIVLA